MASQNIRRQYYFAFGSNMCLAQMVERCPGSSFIGKATLPGYRWQINQRHVANIVKVDDESQSDVVEGLVFSITDNDRRTLDRKEGIKIGVYERVEVVILLKRDADLAGKKAAFVRARLEDDGDGEISEAFSNELGRQRSNKDGQVPLGAHQRPQSQEEDGHSRVEPTKLQYSPPALSSQQSSSDSQGGVGKPTEAITYLSTRFTEDGLIRKEYVQRMENAMRDALNLGVSREYFQKYLEPCVHGPISPPDEAAPGKRLASRAVGKKEGHGEEAEGDLRGVRARPAAGLEHQRAKRPQPRDPASQPHRTEKKSDEQSSRTTQPQCRKGEGKEDGRMASENAAQDTKGMGTPKV